MLLLRQIYKCVKGEDPVSCTYQHSEQNNGLPLWRQEGILDSVCNGTEARNSLYDQRTARMTGKWGQTACTERTGEKQTEDRTWGLCTLDGVLWMLSQ